MLTVVIPTLNEEKYLPKLLRDIAGQTLQPDEIIVADAHSTDATRVLAQQAGATVVDGGLPGVGRNNGATKAKNGIIVFFDADVRLSSSTFLDDSFKEFKKRKLDIATCDIWPSDGTAVNTMMFQTYNLYARLLEKIKPHAAGMCIFITKKIHDRISGFDEKVMIAEDMDYVQRAAQFGKFGILRSWPIITTTRRFMKDGNLKTIIKYLLTELHMATLGSVKTDIFNYKFGYTEAKEKSFKKRK